MPIHAEAIIWNGSHGPTPAVSSADANSDVQPSTNPNPGPRPAPASTSRKNTVSIPAVPAPSGRSAALIADEHAEHRQRLGVHAALGQLGEHDHDQHRQHRHEDERRVADVLRRPGGRHGEQRPAEHRQPGDRREPEHRGRPRTRPDGAR